MNKTKAQKTLIRENGARPLFWAVVREEESFLHIRHRLTGETRVILK